MSRRQAKVVVLCEDQQQATLAESYLKELGYGAHQIRPKKCPSGKQAGEQWVRVGYPRELKELRGGHTQSSLIVIIDEDGLGAARRMAQLEQACRDAAVPVRQPGEPVAIIIPARNIETWIRYLEGLTVDEQTDYKRPHDPVKGCRAHAQALRAQCLQGLPRAAPGQLMAACPEVKRI